MKATWVQVPPVIDGASVRAFAQEFERGCSDQASRVILLAGSNGVFCQGMNLARLTREPVGVEPHPDFWPELEAFAACLRQIRYAVKPVVAVVEGAALAGGVGIAAACDLVVATADSTFGLSELLFGLVPAIVLPLLLERMPAQQARLWAMAADAHSASEAQAAGLVDVVVAPLQLGHTVSRWVRRLSRTDQAAVAKLKSFSAVAVSLGFEAALARGIALTGETLAEAPALNRIRSFLDSGTAPWEVA